MNEVKFCKDCKYYNFIEKNRFDYEKHICLYNIKRINYITGEIFEIEQFCYNMRIDENECGKDAKYFYPKE